MKTSVVAHMLETLEVHSSHDPNTASQKTTPRNRAGAPSTRHGNIRQRCTQPQKAHYGALIKNYPSYMSPPSKPNKVHLDDVIP